MFHRLVRSSSRMTVSSTMLLAKTSTTTTTSSPLVFGTNVDGIVHSMSTKNDNDKETPKTWIDKLPAEYQPYAYLARLDKPIGTYLLLWPCLFSTAMASDFGQLPSLGLVSTFAVGSVVMRGAGCTINDMWDRDIDAKVERTKTRPLASGQLSMKQAMGFLAAQLGVGLGVLLTLNDYTIALGASSLALVATYPLMKRITYYPQAFLGLTFNWGAFVGWAAVHETLDLSVTLPLYAGCMAWTIFYDTIYAHQDKEDDVKVGVKSTALLFGDQTKDILKKYGGAAIVGMTLAGVNAGMGWPFFLGTLAASGHLYWQLKTVDLDNREDCMAKFVSNRDFGAIMFASMVAGNLWV